MSWNTFGALGRLATLVAVPLALSACQGEKKPAEAGTAQGEILEGSASDAMLPLDTVRSQPPLAPEAISSGEPGRKAARGEASGDAGDTASEAAEAPTAEAPSPAATPTAKATPKPAE